MVEVVDSIMGSGKTSFAIQMMNDNPSKKYMFITPYLEEVGRIKASCVGFEEPDDKNGQRKTDSLNQLITAGKSIVSTHALFKLMTKETMKLLKKSDYTLILDEVLEVISVENLQDDDLNILLKSNCAHVDPATGYLVWDKDSHNGRYADVKRLCETKNIEVTNDTALVWVFPDDIFNCFSETYILTYMFDVQLLRYYFDLKAILYERFQLVNNGGKYNLVPHNGDDGDTSKININILGGKKNEIGTLGTVKKGKRGQNVKIDPYFNLSCSWYEKADASQLKRIKNNTGGYFKNDLKLTK
ncbi:hypothetical protein AXX12_11350 [Anaerosporomusa subterranea]|uniref:Uncharacterized protein n=1 Tax=Anaerosporomusa subterranea TaxID=1794912 RepID=A0A154BPG2_ANASB|nr:hypothetical protein [Anaerosporomusa subterranea]KYZ75789.1 hypothetical protein AXX12_11350 [Anaerosporomusa subterranea]